MPSPTQSPRSLGEAGAAVGGGAGGQLGSRDHEADQALSPWREL